MDQDQSYNEKVGYVATDPSSNFNNYGFQSSYSTSKSYTQNAYFTNNPYNQLQY